MTCYSRWSEEDKKIDFSVKNEFQLRSQQAGSGISFSGN